MCDAPEGYLIKKHYNVYGHEIWREYVPDFKHPMHKTIGQIKREARERGRKADLDWLESEERKSLLAGNDD